MKEKTVLAVYITTSEDGYRYEYRYGDTEYVTIEPRNCIHPPTISTYRQRWEEFSQLPSRLKGKTRHFMYQILITVKKLRDLFGSRRPDTHLTIITEDGKEKVATQQ